MPLSWAIVPRRVQLGELDKQRARELAEQCPGIPPEATLPHCAIVCALRIGAIVLPERMRKKPMTSSFFQWSGTFSVVSVVTVVLSEWVDPMETCVSASSEQTVGME